MRRVERDVAVRGGAASTRFGVSRVCALTLLGGLLTLGACSGEAAAPTVPWSPDDALLLYTSNAEGAADIVIGRGVDATRNLTRTEASDHAGDWSPDGRHIAFQSQRDGQREIYLMSAAGTGVANLTANAAQDLLPAFSPDGSQILFFSDRGIEHGPRELPGNLYVLTLEDGTVERLTEEPLTSTFGGRWSPDGATVVFARDFGGDIDLVLLDLASGQETRVDGTEDSEYGAAFSPDGRRIAFHASSADGESTIVVMNADLTGRETLTRGGQHYGPRWSPDGNWLVFAGAPLDGTNYDLLVVAAGGGEVRSLIATEHDERAGSWAPSTPR